MLTAKQLPDPNQTKRTDAKKKKSITSFSGFRRKLVMAHSNSIISSI